MAGHWLPKPSLKDTSNQEDLVTFIPFHLHQHHSTFIINTLLHDHQSSQQPLDDGVCWHLATEQNTRSEVGCHSKAKIKARGNESNRWPHPSHLSSCQIMDLKVTEVQCHQCLRDREVLGIHIVADGPAGNPEAIWKSTCQSSRMRMLRTPSHTKVGAGT